MLSAHSAPFLIHGHRMHLANSRAPSPAFILSIVHGRYEPGTTRLLERVLKPGMIVLDVGAHVGYFALLAARLVGSEGTVFAFEPDPSNFELLQKNIALNSYATVATFRKAVAECSGPMTLFLDAKGRDRNSLVSDGEPLSGQDTVEVETVSLDEFLEGKNIKTVDLLKIDAEGAECSILRGMRRSLHSGRVSKMIFEFTPAACEAAGVTPEEFLGQLTDSGFDLYRIEMTGDLMPVSSSGLSLLVAQVRAKGACSLFAE
jgi:FkbM family methyltransferase